MAPIWVAYTAVGGSGLHTVELFGFGSLLVFTTGFASASALAAFNFCIDFSISSRVFDKLSINAFCSASVFAVTRLCSISARVLL